MPSELSNFPLSAKDLLLGGLAPTVIAVGVWRFSAWIYGRPNRHSYSVAVLLGFLAGYGLLSLAPWQPAAHWHWLPHLLLLACLLGPIACAAGVSSLERLITDALVATAAAWILVPNWDDLSPTRNIQMGLVFGAILVWSWLFRLLAKKRTGFDLSVILWMTYSATSIVLMLSGSLRFCQIAIAMSAASFGLAMANWFLRSLDENDGRYSIGAASLLSGVALTGLLYVGWVNSFSDVPNYSYILVAVAPLLAGVRMSHASNTELTAASRTAKLGQLFRAYALPLIALTVATGTAAIRELSSGY